jgi:hypothetical protein
MTVAASKLVDDGRLKVTVTIDEVRTPLEYAHQTSRSLCAVPAPPFITTLDRLCQVRGVTLFDTERTDPGAPAAVTHSA